MKHKQLRIYEKVRYILTLHALLFCFFTMYAAQSIFYGSIQFPAHIKNPPPLALLFKGCEYTLMVDKDGTVSKKGTFEIYEEGDCHQLYLLITEHLKLPATPDIEHLETEAGHSYKLYKLTRCFKKREVPLIQEDPNAKPAITLESIQYWEIEEVTSQDPSIKIPDNTIIFLMNPAFIADIASEPSRSDDAIVKLPSIVFADSINEKALQEVSTKMLFATLDLRCLHKKITKTTKTYAQNRILSVPDPLNCYTPTNIQL